MRLIEEIEENYANCIASRCRDAGCRIKLDKVCSKHILISGEKYQRWFNYNNKLCDFILFDCTGSVKYRLAVIEMKSGNVDEHDMKGIHEQLQNGANIADQLSSSYEVQSFIPVAVKKKGLHVMASKTLLMNDKYKVRFRSFCEMIKILKNDGSLEFT